MTHNQPFTSFRCIPHIVFLILFRDEVIYVSSPSTVLSITKSPLIVCRVEHVYQFIQRRLPEGIYGSDDEIDPLKRGFETLSLDELKAKIDLAYREVSTVHFEYQSFDSISLSL